MDKKSFFNNNEAIFTCMVQADNPDRIRELIDKAAPQGAEAFGIQFEQMRTQYRNRETYRTLFEYAGDKPVYVTNYRHTQNEGKTDSQLADELLELAECGADLCDVMGDYFNKQPGEITYDPDAVEKQKRLIKELHKKGAKVLMSSHVFQFLSADEVLKIASSHQSRGADISKIVVNAANMEQQLENLKIMTMLKEKLSIPFLFLSGGECRILRRIGGEFGSCMYLCVYEYDKFATSAQPLLKDVKIIHDLIKA